MRSGLLFVLAGCNQLFGLDRVTPQDAPTPDVAFDAPGCSGATFSVPMLLPPPFTDADWDPSTNGDPNELWFARNVGNFDLYSASGPDFSTVTPFPFNATGNDNDPAHSSDGLVMIYRSTGTGTGYRAFESRRSSRMAPWAQPTLVAPLSGTSMDRGLDLSFDGLTLYFAETDGKLRMARRTDRNSPFEIQTIELADDVSFPSISPDGLELFFMRPSTNTTGTYLRTRTSVDVAFDPAFTLITLDHGDPELSTDAETLYLSRGSGGGMFKMTRSCN